MFAKSIALDPQRQSLLQCTVFLFCLIALFSSATAHFLTLENLLNVLTASTVIGLMACGASFVIASGGIDLSTAAAMALAGVIGAAAARQGCQPAIIIAITALVGTAVGALNGWLVSFTRAPSFVVTLGMLSVARALAFIITGGTPIYGLADTVTALGQSRILTVPGPVLFLAAGFAIAAWLLSSTRFGAHTLIYGDNPFAARAFGIETNLLLIRIYALAGAFSGIAGFVFMARTNSGDPTAGQNYELIAITAVILGGANLFGGRVSMTGTMVGVLCLGVLQNGLNLLAIGTFYQILFVGLVLLASALLRRTSGEQ